MIGPWLVEPQLNLISKDQTSCRVEPKVMAVLCTLAQRPGQPVSKQELTDVVWGGLAVSEGALKHLIWETRKQLGDDAKHPRYVETIPKVGYRLIAPVREAGTEVQQGNKAFTRIWKKAFSPAAVTAWAIVLGFTLWLVWPTVSRQHAVPERLGPIKGRPITSFHGLEVDPALSPDGNRVVFSRKRAADLGFDLFVQELQPGAETVCITQGQGDELHPRWSPDGNILAFKGDSGRGSAVSIFTTKLKDGHPRRLPMPHGVLVEDFDWSPLGGELAVSLRPDFFSPLKIQIFNLAGEPLGELGSEGSSQGGDQSPVYSPDGKKLAFIRNWSEWAGDIFVADLETGSERRLTFDHGVILGVTWEKDGHSLIFSSDRRPPRGLWRVSVEGGDPQWVPVTAKHPHNPATSRANGSLVYQEVSCDPNLWVIDADTAAVQPMKSDIASTLVEYAPQVAPRGNLLAFLSQRSGFSEVWILDLKTDTLKQATTLEGPYLGSLNWSPQGDTLLMDAWEGNDSKLYQLDVRSGRLTTILTGQSNCRMPSWSADGRSFYFSAPGAGRMQIWKYDGALKTTRMLTTEGGFMALEDWQSGTLYFSRRETGGIWKRDAATGETLPVVDDLFPEDAQNWALSQSGIFYVRSSRFQQEMVFQRFDGRDSRSVCRLSFVSPYPGMSVSQDGRFVYFGKVEAYESDLMWVPKLAPFKTTRAESAR